MTNPMPRPPVVARNNIAVRGTGQPMLFAHGYGCNQDMWRFVVPAFEDRYQVVLFDHVGAGGSDLSQYRPEKYATLQGYADDILEICDQLGLEDVIFVGHSVSTMIGVLAAIDQPRRFAQLILIGPSACYINDGNYVGGFDRSDIDELLDQLDSNHLGWSRGIAKIIMANPERPELADELTASFCQTDPAIAKAFARTTFLSDNRSDLGTVSTPALVLQCSEDLIAPDCAGRYVHEHLAHSTFVKLAATGHCPHLSAPHEAVAAIERYLGEL